MNVVELKAQEREAHARFIEALKLTSDAELKEKFDAWKLAQSVLLKHWEELADA